MLQAAFMSHSIGAIVFAITTTVLLFHTNTRKQIPILIGCMLMTGIWCASASLYLNRIIDFYAIVAITEILQDIMWCFCVLKLIHLLHNTVHKNWFDSLAFKVFLGALTGALIVNSLFMGVQWRPEITSLFSKFSYFGHISISVIALALLEHLYVGTPIERRWGIKFICIGLGILFCYDFYLFANAVMLQSINSVMWEVRGGVCALVAPLITIGTLRNRKWQSNIMPSRKLIFSSTAFISCGIYLIVMASVGYGIRELGGNWGQPLQVIFFTGSLMLLAILLLSGSARAYLQQFMANHFFKLRYDYRKEWLNISSVLAQSNNQSVQQLTIKTIANLVESPKGWLFEVKQEACKLVETWNAQLFDSTFIISDKDFLSTIHNSTVPILIHQEWLHLFDQAEFKKEPWLIVPLKSSEGCSHFILLGIPRLKIKINWEVKDILIMAGRHFSTHLLQQQQAKDLAVAKQFEAYNQFSTFIVHDLKNIDTQLKLMAVNKQKHGDNPKFVQSVYQTIDNLSDKFSKLISQIKTSGEAKQEVVTLSKVLHQVVKLRAHKKPQPTLDWSCSYDEVEVLGVRDQFINILCHLVENAQQATKPSDQIKMIVTVQDKTVSIRVKDTGQGMSADFVHNQLFKPFVSTKGKKGMGIGVYQAKRYIEQQAGTLLVQSELGVGTEFIITLPVKHVVTKNHITYCETDMEKSQQEVGEVTNC